MVAVAVPPCEVWAGRPGRPSAAVYRRRRILAAVLLAVLMAASFLAGKLVLGGLGGGPLTAPEPSGPGTLEPAAVRVYVVQPGDTLWSIATATAAADPRPMVDRLMAERHGRPLQVGEGIALP